MWTKVTPSRASKPKRASFGVSRGRSGFQAATLIIPTTATVGPRASIYSDGNGKIAFAFGDKGELKVSVQKSSRKIAIPKQLSHLIPFGTRDVNMTDDGGMLVLDTAQLRA
jgi:hypothetical protein